MLDQGSSPSNPNVGNTNFALKRRIMVDRQIRTFDVTDQAVLERILDVPREIFLPADLAPLAYSDGELRVAGSVSGELRTLVAPLALARLLQAASLAPAEKALVIADGPGYATALIAGLVREVVALESASGFAERTLAGCGSLGLTNVTAVTGPLVSGYRAASPYDVIFVLGVAEEIPDDLATQLSDRGRIMTFQKPEHDPAGRAAKATRITRVGRELCGRPLFDAGAPVLDAFRAKPQFVF